MAITKIPTELIDTTSHMDFLDGEKLRLGTSNDLQLYHDGSHSYIKDDGTGNLYLGGSAAISFNSSDFGETYAIMNDDGAVVLYHNNVAKLSTDAQGINVTGGIDVADITATGNISLNSDSGTAYFGAGADLRIYHDGTDSHIQNTQNNGVLRIRSQETYFVNSDNNETQAKFIENGAVTLYHDNAQKFSTTSTGVTVTGDISGTTATASGGTSTTALASTAFVQQELTTLIGGAPSTLNDLNELAAAINDDSNYNSTLTTALATKMPLAGGTFTGPVTIGADDTGHDLRLYGATTSRYTEWDESMDLWRNRDSVKVIFGNGDDLQIFHDGSNSFINNTSGNAGNLSIKSSGINLMSAASETYATFAADGAATLYHNNAAKINTTSTGLNVTGNITTSTTLSSFHDRVRIVNGSAQINIGQWDTVNHRIETDANRPFKIYSYNTTSGIALGISGSDKLTILGNGSGISVAGSVTSTTGFTTGANTRVQASSGMLFLNGPSAVTFEVGAGSEKMRLTSTGLGIGTSSPIAPLHVAGNAIIETGSPDLYFATSSATHTNWRLAAQENVSDAFEIASGTQSASSNAIADTYTTRFVVKNSGNVGIGTTDPGAPLHIQTNNSTTNTTVDMLRLTTLSTGTTTTGFGGAIHFQAERNNGVNQSVGRIKSVAEVNSGTNISSGLAFDTSTAGVPSEKVRFTYDGKVGIGTASPVAKLHIQGAGAYNHTPGQNTTSDFVITSSEMSDNNAHSIMQLVSVRQSLSTGSGSTGYLGFTTMDDSNAQGIRDAGRIAIVNETGTSRNSPTALSFWTNAGGTDTTAATEKMRIGSSGNVGIGTTNPSAKCHLYTSGSEGINLGIQNSERYYKIETDGGNLSFTDVSAGLAERMTILANGNVGIGTTSPGAPLALIKPSLTTTGTGEGGLRVHRPNSASQYGYFDYGYNGGGVNIGSLYTGQGAASFGTFTFRQHSSTTSQVPMLIDNVGNVGIGTTSPSTKLNVKHTGGTGVRVETDGDTDSNFLHFKTSSSTGQGYIGTEGSTAGANFTGTTAYAFVAGSTSSGTDTQFLSAGAVRATIDHTGRVGIGTSNPSNQLVVKSGTGVDMEFGSEPTAAFIQTYNRTSSAYGHLRFVTNGETMRLTNTGNVGIGRSANLRDKLTVTKSDSTTSYGQTTAAIEITNSDNSTSHYSALNFRVATGTYNESLATVSARYSGWNTNVLGELSFGTRGIGQSDVTEHMRISHAGRVGLGNWGGGNPVYALDVKSTDNGADDLIARFASSDGVGRIQLADSSGTVDLAAVGNDFHIFTNYSFGSTAKMVVRDTGNVGIGTTAPTAKLHTKETVSNTISAATAGVKFDGSGSDGLAFGNKQSSPYTSWIQAGYLLDGYSPAFNNGYPIALNPIGGNVGIGTDNPTTKLQVNGASDSRVLIYETGTSPYTATLELSSQAIGTYGAIVQYTSAAEILTIQNYGRAVSAGSSTGSIAFKTKVSNTTPTDVMFIHGFTGNVGIGTTTPNTNVQIYHATDDVSINVNHGTGGSYPKKSGISFGATSTSLGGDATFTGGAGIQAINTAAANNPTEMAFFTTSGGSPTERMRIDSSGDVGIGTTSPDSSASMGGQTPILTVDGYTSLDGLRVAGSDSGNTIYKTGGNMGIVSASHAVNVTGSTQVNLAAGSNTMFRAAVNKWSLGGGTYSHGRVRSYHYHASLSIGQTVALLQNTGAHTDINFIYWIEAFHSSRSYRTGMGTFGGYGMHKTSASNGGLDIYGTSVSSGIMRLDIQANTSYATSYHISMMIFGDSGITVHNGTLADVI